MASSLPYLCFAPLGDTLSKHTLIDSLHRKPFGSSQISPKLLSLRNGATLDDKGLYADPAPFKEETQLSKVFDEMFEADTGLMYGLSYVKEVEESIRVLKTAAKTRKVEAKEILGALSIIEKAKLDSSGFLETLGGTESPGRTWMLVFTAEKKMDGGRYFPITAVQRFDAAGKRIENGVYLGSLGSLTFEGRFAWKKRMLAFVFEEIRVKVGPFDPLKVRFNSKDIEREPGNRDPFFIWFYIDEEIAVARGRSGGTAFWVRSQRVGN